ncbi:MBL fold metallo-hydrolase [Parvularcula lutaonensis]|uniref:MBL fold metallo-hydrolase n=1 Tax=Parvularcula lutaonensis TaxID=491923 RepID=A0ABV7M9A1_9PROT|nr:MBL fold metallo-hydrolase [Parvularcula lutaonensis]GGY42758.1 MBL fold metallo-hydrolase [Parvularcula lutaonensis]
MGIPFVHAPDLERGQPERLTERITRVIANNPGPFTYTGSGTYLLQGEGETWAIDPGPLDEAHLALLKQAAPSPITKIMITHTHSDHCGGANALKERTGATTFGFGPHPSAPDDSPPALDEGADHSFKPDELLSDGDSLVIPGLTIRALHTPGHISNHLCFVLEEEGALFTGDHIMGWATTVVAPPDGDMRSYMKSLDLLLERRDRVYYPTHGAPITDPLPFVEAVREHRLGRDAAILRELEAGARSIEELVEAIYVGLNPALKIAAGLNVKAHLDGHVSDGTAEEIEPGRFALL